MPVSRAESEIQQQVADILKGMKLAYTTWHGDLYDLARLALQTKDYPSLQIIAGILGSLPQLPTPDQSPTPLGLEPPKPPAHPRRQEAKRHSPKENYSCLPADQLFDIPGLWEIHGESGRFISIKDFAQIYDAEEKSLRNPTKRLAAVKFRFNQWQEKLPGPPTLAKSLHNKNTIVIHESSAREFLEAEITRTPSKNAAFLINHPDAKKN